MFLQINDGAKVGAHRSRNLSENGGNLSEWFIPGGEMEDNGEIRIVGALYDMDTGRVEFL